MHPAMCPGLFALACLAISPAIAVVADAPTAEAVRKAVGIDAGLGLVVADEAGLACDLAEDGRLLVHLLTSRDDLIPSLRDAVQTRGLAGRVIVQALPKDGHLPHPDRFVNLVVADLDKRETRGLKRAEVERVLAVRGAAFVRTNGRWQTRPASRNEKLDDWTHRFYDASGNCVSRDVLAALPRAVQWQHGPALEDGTADGKVPRVADGRFVAFDGLSGELVCRDASNGSLLWRRFIGSPQNADLAIESGQVYLYHDAQAKPVAGSRYLETGPLVAIALATGALTKTYDEALRAGTATAVETEHHEDAKRFEKYHPVPWFIVRDDVIVQAYGSELLVLDRVSGRRRFVKSLDAAHTWFSPVLAGSVLLAAEAVGAARRGRHDGATHVRAVTAFDLATGKTKWRNADVHPVRTVTDERRGPFPTRAEFKPLSVADSLVLIHVSSYQFRHGGRIAVLDADSGRELWHRDFQPKELSTQGSQRAVLRGGAVVVLDGWGAFRFDARTGAAIGNPWKLPREFQRQARRDGACTASRATVDWLICNAYLYVGPDGTVASCFGARGACGQGVVPANGLLYVNPTACDCGDYTRGYEALSPRQPGEPLADADRLVRGPAFDATRRGKLSTPETGWPIFLGDAQRRSCSTAALPAELAVRWQNPLVQPRRDALDADRRQSERYLGALSAPVAAGGYVLVAAPERHQVLACDPATGKLQWSFQAGGKVDSPPTIVLAADSTGGRAIFGCEDGAVYALRLADGQLAWKFTAAATDGLARLHGHLASAMPLPGSVLVLGDVVVVAAGQHTDLGGLHFYALDAATGEVRASRVIAADQPAVVTNDILVADAAGGIWLGNGRSQLHLSATLEDLPVAATKPGTASPRPVLAFDRQGSRVRFRTDVGRGGSTHGWAGAMRTSSVSAHRIASDHEIAYALWDPTASDRHPVRAPRAPAVVSVTGGRERRQRWAAAIGALGSRESYSALVKCGDRLYIGGGTRDGSAGFLQVLDAGTGRLLATHELPSRVTECGLAADAGRLFVCCEGGEVICWDRAE